MYSYIHSYVSLCICICIMSMHCSLKHTYVYLGAFPPQLASGERLGISLSQEWPTREDSAPWCYNLRAVEERWSSLLECVRFSPTHRILPPPPTNAFQHRSLAALNAIVNAKWSIIGFYRIQQDYHYVVKYGLRVWSINVLTFHLGWYFSSLKIHSSAKMHMGSSLLSLLLPMIVVKNFFFFPIPLLNY